MAWFESVAKSRPPWKPFSNAMSIAGPWGKSPPPLEVGLARGPRSFTPFSLKTRMSGVKGLVAENVPPTVALVSSLHLLGKPCPDSRTNTSNRCLLPRNATAVGKFRPLLKTEIVKPSGTTMSSPLPGLNLTSSPGHKGFAAVPAAATSVGWVSSSVRATATNNQLNRLTLLCMSTPSDCALLVHRAPNASRRSRRRVGVSATECPDGWRPWGLLAKSVHGRPDLERDCRAHLLFGSQILARDDCLRNRQMVQITRHLVGMPASVSSSTGASSATSASSEKTLSIWPASAGFAASA